MLAHPRTASRPLWLRWTLVTVLGEIVGLGGAGILAGVASTLTPADPGTTLLILLTAAMLASGAGEGAVVGYAQSRVLRHALPDLPARRWIAATATGALLAWALGAGVFMAVLPDDAAFEDYLPLMLLLGVACGTLLGAAQWLALRGHVGRSWLWITANTAGWAVGLMWAFFVPMAITEDTPLPVVIPLALATGLGTGLAPGAVTGYALDRLVRQTKTGRASGTPRSMRA
ncbi:MAG: hypothetical protein AB7F65_04170 [Dehalococcoidia bacterium]